MHAWLWRLFASLVIMVCIDGSAEAARSRTTHGINFSHHTGFFSGTTSGGFSVSPHRTRVFFSDFTDNGFVSQRMRRNFFFRQIVVLNPGPVPPFTSNNLFFSGTIVPPFTIGTPINSFFVPRFFFRSNGFNFGFFSPGFRNGRFNQFFFAPVGLTGGSGGQTVFLMTDMTQAAIPAAIPVPTAPAKAQIVVLHTWPGTDKVKIFAPTGSAQGTGARITSQIAEVPSQ